VITQTKLYEPDPNEMLMDAQIEYALSSWISLKIHSKLQFNHAMFRDKKIMLTHFKSLIDNLK
jgi:hypothetical protein